MSFNDQEGKIARGISYAAEKPKVYGYRKAFTGPLMYQSPSKVKPVKFKHTGIEHDLIIPIHQNDCKDAYKIIALKKFKEIFPKN